MRAPVSVASPRLAALVGPLQGAALPEGTRDQANRPATRSVPLLSTTTSPSWVGIDPAKMSSMAEVYALVCPTSGKVRYIGLSTGDSRNRFKAHLSVRAAPTVREWVASLRPLEPLLTIVASGLTLEEAQALERELVVRTADLLNHSLQAPTRKLAHRVNPYPDSRVIPGPNWVKWWRTKLNDELGPWHGADLARRP